MKPLFQHGHRGEVSNCFALNGASDRCAVDMSHSGSFPQANAQILDRFGQRGCDLLAVIHMNGGSGFEYCMGPLTRFDEIFQRVSGTDSGGHVIMLEVFLRTQLTSGAFMRHYVALQEIRARGAHGTRKADPR